MREGIGNPSLPRRDALLTSAGFVCLMTSFACRAIMWKKTLFYAEHGLYEHERFLCPQTVYRGRSIPTGCSPVAHDESYSEAHKRRPKRDAGGREVPPSCVRA